MLFDQSERGHSVRTGCTSRGVGTMFDQSGHSILISAQPQNVCTASHSLKKRVDRPLPRL